MLTQVVQELKIMLATDPYDIGHDVQHHSKVWENCNWIIDCEKLEGIDMDALQIAAFAHDLERKSDTHDKLQEIMKKHGYQQDFVDKVVSIINEHSHDDSQTSMEGEVLFDADKLEYVGLLRWQTVFRAFADGVVDGAHVNKYKSAWNKRMEYIPQSLHFKCTKKKFTEDLKSFLAWAEKEGMAKEGKLVL